MLLGVRCTAIYLAATMLSLGAWSNAGLAGIHRKRAKVLCAIPGKHRYDRGRPRVDEAIISGDAIAERVDLLPATTLWRKRFRFADPALQVEDIRLSHVGIALYETGKIVVTAHVRNDAKPTQPPNSRRVTLWIRAYGSSPSGVPRVNAPVLWQEQLRFSVRQGRTRRISFTDRSASMLRRHFHEIHHFELIIQFDKSDSSDDNENAASQNGVSTGDSGGTAGNGSPTVASGGDGGESGTTLGNGAANGNGM